MCHALDTASKEAPLTDEDILNIAKVIGEVVGCESYELVNGPDVQCEIRADLLAARRAYAKGPDAEPEEWCRSGGPLGLRCFPRDRGIFPRYDVRPEMGPEAIDADDEGTYATKWTMIPEAR